MHLGCAEDLPNTGSDYMNAHLIYRAAIRLDRMIYRLVDRISGNAARRRALKQKALFAMMASEHRSLIKVRAQQLQRLGRRRYRSLLALRAHYYRHTA